MSLPNPSDFTRILGSQVRALKEHLEGAVGSTAAWHFRQSSGNAQFTLADAAGATQFRINDSGGVDVFHVDSDGNVTISGSIAQGSFTFPTSASPAPTTEGRAEWDTDDDLLAVGDGASTKLIVPTPTTTAGDIEYASGARAHSRLAIGTAGQVLKVNSGATAPEWGAADPFDGIRTQFRANRRLVAEYSAQHPAHTLATDAGAGVAAIVLNGPTGLGYYQKHVTSDTIYAITGEPFARFGNGAVVTRGGVYTGDPTGAMIAVLSPSHSPRMLTRVDLPAASANLTGWYAGFFDINGSNPAANAAGAFLRLVTTGNLFFVTRQASVETTTDLGVTDRTIGLGFEIETTDGGVTWVCRNQAGTVLATHTTNVPTAATALAHGVVATTATGAIPHGIAYIRVEGTFA